jgi:tetratricopeptide (TPR) repeat protein
VPGNLERASRLASLVEGRYGAHSGDPNLLVNTEEFKRRTREVVVLTGRLDYEEHRYGTARAMFEKVVPADGRDPVAHHYLGRIALDTGGEAGLPVALRHLEDAITADGGYGPAYRELGLVHYRLGDAPAAITAFERYLELVPRADDAARVQQSLADLRRQ